MKNIWRVFFSDFKRISTNVVAIVIMLGLAIIPALYAWFNILSNWDPYGEDATSQMKISVYSEDEGFTYGKLSLNVGDSVIEGLKANTTIGWVFSDTREEALEGVYSGEYYASLIIPKDFTEDMISFIGGNLEHPTIQYYENSKKNAIATKITGKAKTAVQQQVNTSFLSTLAKVTASAGETLSGEEGGVSILDQTLDKLKETRNTLNTNISILKSFALLTNSTGDLIGSTQSMLPGINSMIDSSQNVISNSQTAITAGSGVANGAKTLLDSNIDSAISGLEGLDDAVDNLTDLATGSVSDKTQTLNLAMDVVLGSMKDLLPSDSEMEAAKQESNNQSSADKNLVDDAANKVDEEANKPIGDIKDELSNKADEAGNDANQAVSDANQAVSDAASDAESNLEDLPGKVDDSTSKLEDALNGAPEKVEEAKDNLQDAMGNAQTSIKDAEEDLDKKTPAEIAGEIQNSATDSANKVNDKVSSSVSNAVDEINKNQEQINNELAKHPDEVNAVKDSIDELQKNYKALSQAVNDGSNDVSELQDKVSGSVTKSISSLKALKASYDNQVSPQINDSVQNVQNALNSTNRLLNGIDGSFTEVNSALESYEDTLYKGSDNIGQTTEYLVAVRDAMNHVIDGLEKLTDDEQYQEVIDMLKTDPELISEFISSPVKLEKEPIYEIEGYGSAMAPFYSVLALWVGALISVALVHVKVEPDPYLVNLRPYQAFFGRFITFFLLTQSQALITVLGNLFFVQIQCKHPFFFWLAAFVTSFTFSMLMYALTVAFGNVGQAIAVVIMVIQVAGAGGTFPIEVLPKVYQMIYKFLPFPYAMNAMRECVGGMYEFDYAKDLAVLGIFAAVSIFIGLVVAIPFRGMNEKIEESKERSKVML